jgi:hypothetical protein
MVFHPSMDVERSMRYVLNLKNKKAALAHCFFCYRVSGLVQRLLYELLLFWKK